MWAAYFGHFKAFEFLLKKGADPYKKRDSDTTTLSLARKFYWNPYETYQDMWWFDMRESSR